MCEFIVVHRVDVLVVNYEPIASLACLRAALLPVRIEGHLRLPDQGTDPEEEERLKESLRSEMIPLVRYFFVTRARFSASVIGDLP